MRRLLDILAHVLRYVLNYLVRVLQAPENSIG